MSHFWKSIFVFFILYVITIRTVDCGEMGWQGAAEVRLIRTMFVPGVGIPLLGCLLLMLVLLSASESRLTQACPGLITSGCSCTDERSKAHTSAIRKRVACSNEDLSETPDASLLPNRTVTLWVILHVYIMRFLLYVTAGLSYALGIACAVVCI